MSDPRLEALLGPKGPELTCEECFDHLDRFVELEHTRVDPEIGVPGKRAHHAGCPACADDHASLLAFVASQK